MGYLFLDIETYIDPQNPESGLNPYLLNSRVLTISYSYYSKFRLTPTVLGPPTILKEWEDFEKGILLKFYNFLKQKVQIDKNLKLVGFNHQKFDLPYLFGRMIIHQIDQPASLIEAFYVRTHIIDLAQLGMVISSKMLDKKEIYNVSHNEVCEFFKFPLKSMSGTGISQLYREKQFKKIEDYIRNEFRFDKMYIALRDYIISIATKVQG